MYCQKKVAKSSSGHLLSMVLNPSMLLACAGKSASRFWAYTCDCLPCKDVGSLPSVTYRRVFSLARLMDAATDNLGRIRLVWARLWAALSAHLVSAACHPDPRVSVLAVGHLRALAARLLQRAELSCFMHQARARLWPCRFLGVCQAWLRSLPHSCCNPCMRT